MSDTPAANTDCLRISAGSLCVALVLFLLAALPAFAAEVVIVNPDVPGDSISENGLRAIFGMRLRAWPDGTVVKVFTLPEEHPVHERFAKENLKTFPHTLTRAWERLVYSGTGQAPTPVRNVEEMLRRVASSPGGIGYAPQESVDDGVRVLRIR